MDVSKRNEESCSMARRAAEEDWDDEGDADGDAAADDRLSHEDDDSFDDDFDNEPTIACPYCHRAIHEDSLRCPYCENYISAEDSPAAGKSWFIILGTIIAMALVYWWITH
jgi:hypothetical protein